jgi:murein DD-endopeptidase MepM/ murein hydrolase activator NlpD
MRNSDFHSPLRIKIMNRLRGNVSVLIGVLGIGAAIWAVQLNWKTGSAVASLPPASESTPLSPQSQAEIILPEFYGDSGDHSLTREADLFTESPFRSRVEILRYTVQPGDAVFGIARRFNIKPETVLWGNYEVLNDDPHLLRVGQELTILPVDGTYYHWQGGDNIEQVAQSFGVEPEAILEWPGNNVDPLEPVLEAGRWIVVPGGTRPFRQWLIPTIARGQAGVGTALGPGGCTGDYSGGAIGTGGFIWPSANHYISGNDFWSGHLAIDIAAGLGAPIWAADGGVVVFAGWSTVGYGNMVMLDHGNGWQTVYAHLSQVSVVCGQSVSQGQRIGLAGSTGNSTGSHLHFETRHLGGYINPWFVLP